MRPTQLLNQQESLRYEQAKVENDETRLDLLMPCRNRGGTFGQGSLQTLERQLDRQIGFQIKRSCCLPRQSNAIFDSLHPEAVSCQALRRR